MGRKLNLTHLSEEECEKILQVIQRDFELRQKEKERLCKIEEEITEEDSKRSILAKQKDFNENCCMRCFSRFIFIFNQKVQCYQCDYFICKSCANYDDKVKKYYCKVCEKQDSLKVQTCDWFYTNVKRRFKRFGSAKVVRSLYKRKGATESETDSGYDPSLHSNSLPVGKRPRTSIEGFFANIPKEFRQDILSSGTHQGISEYSYDDNGNAQTESELSLNQPYTFMVPPGCEAFHEISDKEVDRFKRELNGIVDDLHNVLENQNPPSERSQGDEDKDMEHLLDNHRLHISNALDNLIQSLHHVIEKQELPEPLQSTTAQHHYVRQVLTDEIEQYVGQPIDLGDDVTSEYFSEDGSTNEMPSPRPYKDILTNAILKKIMHDHRSTEAQRHVDEELIVREQLTGLSNQCTLMQITDVMTESETDDPQSSTQTSINIDSELESHYSEGSDGRHAGDGVLTQGDAFASQIDSEIEISGGGRRLEKYGSSDTLKSDEMDLDDLVSLNSEDNWNKKRSGSGSLADVTLTVTSPEGATSPEGDARKLSRRSLSKSPDTDGSPPTEAGLLALELVNPDVLSADDDEDSVFEFAQSHRPALPDFSEDERSIGRGEVDLDDISRTAASSDDEHEDEDEDDDDDDDDDEDGPRLSTTMDSEIMFGDAWTSTNNVSSPSALFKDRSFISAYDNFGQKKVGKDSSGPVMMFIPGMDSGMQSPRIGEKDLEELSDLSENEDRSGDDLSIHSDDETNENDLNDYIKEIAEKEEFESSLDTLDGDPELFEHATPVGSPPSENTKEMSGRAKTPERVGSHTPDRVTPVDADGKKVYYQTTPRKSVDLNSMDFSKLVAMEISKKLEMSGDSSDEEEDADDADPRFVERPRSQTVPMGDTCKFTCQVAGSEPLDVYWYRDMAELKQIEDDEHCEITQKDDGKFVLEIFNTGKDDRGQYLCIAVNDEGQTHRSMKLRLTDNTAESQAPEFLKGLQETEVIEGHTVKFRCKIRGYPQPRVLWYKDGKRITNSAHYRTEKIGNRDYMLTIDHVTLDDDAEYVVTARNASGEARSTAQLLVDSSGDSNGNDYEDGERPLPANLTATSESLYPETEELLKIAEQVHAARTRVVGTAENMLQSADQLNTIHKHLDEMDQTLNNLEGEVQVTSIDDVILDSDNENNNPSYETLSPGMREAIVKEHDEMKYAAGNVRNITTTAIEVLTSTEQYLEQKNATEHAQKTGQSEVSPAQSGLKRKSEEHIIPKLPMETEEEEEELNLSFTEFEKLYKHRLITREQMRKGKLKHSQMVQLRRALEEIEDEEEDEVDGNSLSPDGMNAAIDCGLKRVDSKRYRRDYVINRSPSPQKKLWHVTEASPTSPTSDVIKSTPAGMREQIRLDDTEDQVSSGSYEVLPLITFEDESSSETTEGGNNEAEDNIYMTASKVYTLEERIKLLESQIGSVDEDTSPETLDQLEDQVARAVAKVAHTEEQVSKIEESVHSLKRQVDRTESESSVHSHEASSSVAGDESMLSDRSSNMEGQGPPEFLRGSSTEEDIPESRVECDEELSMPSVKNLRSMFNKEQLSPDGTNIKRVYSLTGRDLPRGVREQLKMQTPSLVASTNIRLARDEGRKRGGIMDLFDDNELQVKDEPLPVPQRLQEAPRSSTPLLDDSLNQPIRKDSHGSEHWDQSAIQASPEGSRHGKYSSPESIKSSPPSDTAVAQPQPIKSAVTSDSIKVHEPIKSSLNIDISIAQSHALKSASSPQSVKSVGSPQSVKSLGSPLPTKSSLFEFKQHNEVQGAEAALTRSILRKTNSFGGADREKEAPPKKNRRSAIMARAAFWDQRIEQGQLSDTSVSLDYPDLPQETFKSSDEVQ